jgi:hypothetical protein
MLMIGDLKMKVPKASPAGTVSRVFGAIRCRTRIILVARPIKDRYVITHRKIILLCFKPAGANLPVFCCAKTAR